uniref:DNA-directed RNA polymerase subunit omega n=1 Tax=Sciadococcus taiwanensis TaxID=3028030 RepID=A0A9Y1I232_9RHOD|nr:DNA-directed RNA polymerase omega chain [Sciadococcus taiwanensis]
MNMEQSTFNNEEILYKTEELLKASSNRYKITVEIANRAKRRRYEDIEILDETKIKPVIRAILEMSDELTQPEIIGD